MWLTSFNLILLLVLSSLHAETRYVKAGSSNPVPPYTSWATASDSIGKCIAAASEGDTILLSDGVFSETLDLKRKMVLQGAGKYQTVIHAGNLPRPHPDRHWIISLTDSNVISGLKITGNANLVTGASTLYAYPNYIRHTRLESIVFDSLETAAAICEGIIRNCRAVVSDFAFVDNPPYSSSVLIENNEMWCYEFLTTYQSPFQPAGVSQITIRKNTVVFNNDHLKIVDDGLGPPNQSFDIYNNDFLVFSSVRISTKLRKKYTWTNNTFHARSFSSPASEQRPAFEIYNQVSFKNNIFSNIAYLFGTITVPITEFKYNVVWRGAMLPFMDSTNSTAYPVYTDINTAITYGHWPVSDTGKLLYNTKLQIHSPVIDKGDPAIRDVDRSRSDPGSYGGPFGESYAYKDTAPMPPFGGFLDLNPQQDRFLARWNRGFDPDLERYHIYLDTSNYYPNQTYLYKTETTDTFAVIPADNFPSGRIRLFASVIDSAGNHSKFYSLAYAFLTDVEELAGVAPFIHEITGIYPNPFNAEAKVDYVIGNRGSAIFRIYDINGALLQTIDKGEQDKGKYNITLKMQNFASGVYFIRLEVRDSYSGKITQTQSKKIVMVK